MESRGFDYVPVQYPADIDNLDRINPLNIEHIRTFGYSSPFIEPVDANPSDDEAFTAAIEGGAEPGCYSVSFDEVYGRILPFTDQLDQTVASMEAELDRFASSEVGLVVTETWSQCMNQRGYAYASPLDPRSEFSEESPPSPQNLEIRLAHYDCDVEVGYTQARHDFQQDAFEAWSQQNETVINDLTAKKGDVDRLIVEIEESAS